MEIDTTVLIPAWNAAAYIQRALESIDIPVQVILVDDYSTDNTVEIAVDTSSQALTVLRPPKKQSLGLVRQTALDAVQTPYAIWLDADDEYLPGRIANMVQPLRDGCADFTTDGQELVDGVTGEFIRDLSIPIFLQGDRDKVRLFERNWLPGIAHVAFCTKFGKEVGYDPELHGGDDSDFVWRSIMSGAKLCFLREKGYRMYAYPGSDSRNISKQRAMVKRALQKHDYNDVSRLYLGAGFSRRITAWGLCSMAIFREDYEAALEFLKDAFPVGSLKSEILEPKGPYPVQEGWRYEFTKGTILLYVGKVVVALNHLENGLKLRRSADTLNNLGVACWLSGEKERSRELFVEALSLFPSYKDAMQNLEADSPASVTLHPLRMQPSRCDY